jgi:hypothetical protein
MVWLRHKGCKTQLIEYVGDVPLYKSPVMRRLDWRMPDGLPPKPNAGMVLRCVDCHARTGVHASQLETCDGSPYRYGDRPKELPKQSTLWECLKALFSF